MQYAPHVVGVAVLLLALFWVASQTLHVVPWSDCVHALLSAVCAFCSTIWCLGPNLVEQRAMLWTAMRECWSQCLRYMVVAYRFVLNTAGLAVTLATSWARAIALQALGLPPDIMERLPPN